MDVGAIFRLPHFKGTLWSPPTDIPPPPSPIRPDVSDNPYRVDLRLHKDLSEHTNNLPIKDFAWYCLLSRADLHAAFANRTTLTLEYCPTLLEWIPTSHDNVPGIPDPVYRLSIFRGPDLFIAIMQHIVDDESRIIALTEPNPEHLGDPSAEESWKQQNTGGRVLGFRGLLQSLIWGGNYVRLERFEDAGGGSEQWRAVSFVGEDALV